MIQLKLCHGIVVKQHLRTAMWRLWFVVLSRDYMYIAIDDNAAINQLCAPLKVGHVSTPRRCKSPQFCEAAEIEYARIFGVGGF